MDFSTINYLAVVVAALSTFMIGAVWYGPIFGKLWMAENGFTEEDLKNANMGKIYGTAFVLEFIMALNLAMFLNDPAIGAGMGAMYGFFTGFGWIALGIGVNYLFSRNSIKLWVVDGGYFAVSFPIMGAILGAWK
ncbi:MAG: DUF1761 domain-containing protein [Bacteroidota bacterium]